MTTRTEKRLLVLCSQRARLIQRIAKAGSSHKATRALQAKLIDTTAEQIKTEIRLERKARAA